MTQKKQRNNRGPTLNASAEVSESGMTSAALLRRNQFLDPLNSYFVAVVAGA
jgi:hypothetical protein